MPSSTGLTGNLEITTYADTHLTDINANGLIINRKDDVAGITVGTLSKLDLNSAADVTFEISSVLYKSYIGPLKVINLKYF